MGCIYYRCTPPRSTQSSDSKSYKKKRGVESGYALSYKRQESTKKRLPGVLGLSFGSRKLRAAANFKSGMLRSRNKNSSIQAKRPELDYTELFIARYKSRGLGSQPGSTQ